MSEAWVELDIVENEFVWNRFEKEIGFITSKTNFPSFKNNVPYITFDISKYYSVSTCFDEAEELFLFANLGHGYEINLGKDLDTKCIKSIMECISEDDFVYVLDWQHISYRMYPKFLDLEEELRIPVFPDGEYYIFLEKNLKWGIIGHPWKQTITFFGTPILEAINRNTPLMFEKNL